MGVSYSSQQSYKEKIFIHGIHTEYPAPVVDDKFLDHIISKVEIGNEQQIAKLRKVNKLTGIKSRPVVLDQDDPFYHRPEPFNVEDITAIWLRYGIPLSKKACLGAIADWGGSIHDITHLVVASCSIQCHPGIDAYIAQEIGLASNVSRILLTGVGCAGAVALLRTANELAIASTHRGEPARVLVVACDLNSLAFRSDSEQLKKGVFPVGLTLFSDAASAAVVSNGISCGAPENAHRPFEIQQWMHHTIPNSLHELQLMPTSIGLVSTISKKLPELIANAVNEVFHELISSMPAIVGSDHRVYSRPSDFDWDVHPGGIGVFDRIIEVMGLTRDHTAATVKTYEQWGNSAGPTVLKVLDVRRALPAKREYTVCCGFGNNLDITMLILKRC